MVPKRWAFARNKPHRNWSLELQATPRAELLPRDLGTDHTKAWPAPGAPDAHSPPPLWPEETAITTATSPAAEPPVQSTFRGRCPGIRELCLCRQVHRVA
jgi:hypothetical protein